LISSHNQHDCQRFVDDLLRQLANALPELRREAHVDVRIFVFMNLSGFRIADPRDCLGIDLLDGADRDVDPALRMNQRQCDVFGAWRQLSRTRWWRPSLSP
jgi:hypothetical protein